MNVCVQHHASFSKNNLDQRRPDVVVPAGKLYAAFRRERWLLRRMSKVVDKRQRHVIITWGGYWRYVY